MLSRQDYVDADLMTHQAPVHAACLTGRGNLYDEVRRGAEVERQLAVCACGNPVPPVEDDIWDVGVLAENDARLGECLRNLAQLAEVVDLDSEPELHSSVRS